MTRHDEDVEGHHRKMMRGAWNGDLSDAVKLAEQGIIMISYYTLKQLHDEHETIPVTWEMCNLWYPADEALTHIDGRDAGRIPIFVRHSLTPRVSPTALDVVEDVFSKIPGKSWGLARGLSGYTAYRGVSLVAADSLDLSDVIEALITNSEEGR